MHNQIQIGTLRTRGCGRPTFSPSKRSEKSVVFPNNIVIDVFDQFGNVLAFLWGIIQSALLSRGAKGIIFGKRIQLSIPVRFSYRRRRCHF